MKKRIFAAALLVVMLVSAFAILGACSERKPPDYVEGKINITYYTWANQSETALFQKLIDAFEAENEDIHVIIRNSDDDYTGNLALMMKGKQCPDIVQMKPGDIDTFLRAGALESLTPYINKSIEAGTMSQGMIWDYNDAYRFNPQTNVRGNHEDELYSLIKDFSCDFVLNYNKNVVTDAVKAQIPEAKRSADGYLSQTTPLTWSEFIKFAASTQSGTLRGVSLDNEPLQQLLEWIQQGGGSLWSDDHKQIVDIVNTPAVRQAFEHYRLMRDENTDNTANYIDSSSQVTRGPAQLMERTAATTFYGLWAYAAYNMDRDATKCVTGFAPTPVPDNLEVTENTRYAGITALVGTSIMKNSANKEAAWKFIEYYFTEGQKLLAKQGSNIPGNKLVANNEFLNDPDIFASQKAANEFFYNLAMEHGFVIDFNKYLSQTSIEKVMSAQLSKYFADSKYKAYNESRWLQCLRDIRTNLQAELDMAVRNA